MYRLTLVALCGLSLALPAWGQRVTMPLDGIWEIADSQAPDRMPESFTRKVPVPGLANLSQPPFADVDRFDSALVIENRIRRKQLPASARVTSEGVARQDRSYFWYRTRFRPSARKEVALLRVGKAQFGTSVWLNGKPAGEHLGCFTAGYFNLTGALDWKGENVLVVRIGAHPGVLPASAPFGTDQEKNLWTPGIYDSVSLILADNPVIESVQVAPRLASSDILIETRLVNYGPPRSFTLAHRLTGGAAARPETVRIESGGRITRVQVVSVPNARLWSPESPYLYALVSSTGGDSLSTRFGMREFRFDTATKRAYLNGKVYFLRGSNITLHRFFEDPQCGRLPWDEKWVRKMLVEIPKRMNWNSFRFCIGPVPDKWLEIADEAGLLIQNEFFVWGWRNQWDTAQLVQQYKDWMRDNWNHPSLAIWDAQNETRNEELSNIIRQVRGLDLSQRPWENGYNLPVGPDDPVEDHPYLFGRLGNGFEISDLETLPGAKSTNSAHPSEHAALINEYGWLWLLRDGNPTVLTRSVYDKLLGPNASAADRFEMHAYLLGGLTEFWRAHRNFAGVLHFVHLTSSYPAAYTADHWTDVEKLELQPAYADYVGEAFKPLGVYLNFWQPTVRAGSRVFNVMMLNDEYAPAAGKLALSLVSPEGSTLASSEMRFELAALGQQTYRMTLQIPARSGAALLRAEAARDGAKSGAPTVSRRKVAVAAQ